MKNLQIESEEAREQLLEARRVRGNAALSYPSI